MIKKLFFTTSLFLFVYNSAFTGNLLAQTEAQSVRPQRVIEQQEATERVRTMSINDRQSNQPADEETRTARRVEAQLNRLVSELNLTEEQFEKARELFVESEKKQAEFRAKINEINTQKMEKFDELLNEEQKKIRSESNSNRENNRELRRAAGQQEEPQGTRRVRPSNPEAQAEE